MSYISFFRRQHLFAGPVGGVGTFLDETLSGAASQNKCQGQREHIKEKKIRYGHLGWPCHRGAAVHIPHESLTSAAPRNCIVFYTPHPAPDLSSNPNAAVQERPFLYNAVAEKCIDEAQKSPIITLSEVTNCIMDQYPDGKGGMQLRLNTLRGNAVFVMYGNLELADDPDIGTAFPEGMIATNCQPIRELNFSPFSICHAALLSAIERTPHATRIRIPPPPLP